MDDKNNEKDNKRVNFIFTPSDIENLKTITDFLENFFGLPEDVGKTAAVRTALNHLAKHIKDKEFDVLIAKTSSKK
jgi:hypothetical protein